MAETLKAVRVKTVSRNDCLARHPRVNRRYIYENTTCSTAPVGRGFCAGDGGCPLVIGEGENRHAIGIASWYVPSGKDFPDVYVRLPDYITWINMISQ